MGITPVKYTRSGSSLKNMDGSLLRSPGAKTRSRVASSGSATATASAAPAMEKLESLKAPPQSLGGSEDGSGKMHATPAGKKEKRGGESLKAMKWRDSLLKARLALRTKREKRKEKHVKQSKARLKRRGDGNDAAKDQVSKKRRKKKESQCARDDLSKSSSCSFMAPRQRGRRKRRPNVRLNTDIGGTSSSSKKVPSTVLRRSSRGLARNLLNRALFKSSRKRRRKGPNLKEKKKRKVETEALGALQSEPDPKPKVLRRSGRVSQKSKKSKLELNDEPPAGGAGGATNVCTFEEQPLQIASKMEMNVYAFNQPLVILSHIGIGGGRENTIYRLEDACVNDKIVCLSQVNDDGVSKGIQALLSQTRSQQEQLRREVSTKTSQSRKRDASKTIVRTKCTATKSSTQKQMTNEVFIGQGDPRKKTEGEGSFTPTTAWQKALMELENNFDPSEGTISQQPFPKCKAMTNDEVLGKMSRKSRAPKKRSKMNGREQENSKNGWNLCLASDTSFAESYHKRQAVCKERCKEWGYRGLNPMPFTHDQDHHQQNLGDISQLEFPLKRPSIEELRAFAKTILSDR